MATKKQPKSWEVIEYEWMEMERMSCVPQNLRKLRVGTIINEDQSVRWNREEVERNNQEYADAVAQLNREKNKYRDSICEDIYYAIQCEVGNGLTRKQALRLWNMAYEDGHAFGWSDLMCHLERLMDLAEILLADVKGESGDGK